MALPFVEQAHAMGANQKFRVLGSAQSFVKKFIAIGFAIAHADQHRLWTLLLRRGHRAITRAGEATRFDKSF